MKRLFIFMASVMMLVLLFSCVREEFESIPEDIMLTARMEVEPETKTVLSSLTNGRYCPLWSAEDAIAVFADAGKTPGRFTLKSGEGTVKATFKGSSQGSRYVAWYPYDMAESVSGNTLSVTLPATQEYVPGSFAQGAFPMIAQGGADGVLEFKNLCAILKLSVTGTAAVNTITVTAKDRSAFLSGKATVGTDYSGVPSLIMSSNGVSSKVTLKCDGVQLSENTPTDFYIVIPAQNYNNGIVIEIDTYAELVSKTIDEPLVFERSQIREIKGLSVSVEMDEHAERIANEKQVLIDFYKSLGGDNWTNNDNWCSDRPVAEWYGISVDNDGYVIEVNLYNNKLTGALRDDISKLAGLRYLSLFSNQITGSIPSTLGDLSELRQINLANNKLNKSIPASLGKLEKLISLQLYGNQLSGQIPEEFGNMKNLYELYMSGNQLSGNLPESIAKLPALRYLHLDNNQLSGILPAAYQNLDFWPSRWGWIVYGNKFDLSEVVIPAPDFNIVDINGKALSSDEIYSSNKCVAFIYWEPWIVRYFENANSSGRDDYMVEMNRLYDLYHDMGMEIIGYCQTDDVDDMKRIIAEYDIKYPNYLSTDNEAVFWHKGHSWGPLQYPYSSLPAIMAANSDKEIEYVYLTNQLLLEDYIISKVGEAPGGGEEPDHYVSKDYSADGTVKTLQTASAGNGVNIVLMGDGYSDRQIADGTYDADMKFAYRNLFTEEPYKSLKSLFNVSYINVVSATEGFEYGDTALECEFGGGTLVYGNDEKCFNYALNEVSYQEMNETLIVVVMNSDAYAGTCWMYWSTNQTTDYGTGVAVAYFPKGQDEDTFAQLLHHEACGHGFAKLADEYDNGPYEIPAAEIEDSKRNMAWGWWKNVDYTSDPALVKWSKFLSDERYAGEGLGVFEGGQTYMYGVWRPTEESIMRYNVGGFNAPSREAIYYRVHKLAYGDGWEYDYETFVEFDSPSRTSSSAYGGSAPQRRRANYVERMREPLAPPVVVPHAWNEK